MKDVEKEYQLWCLCQSIIEFVEDSTDNFDALCDCEVPKGKHDQDCRTMDFRHDFQRYQQSLNELVPVNGEEAER